MTLSTYQSDGQFVPAKLPLAFILSGVGGVILGCVYQFISFYMPCIGYVTVLVLGAFAGALGFMTGYTGKMAHNRSLMIHLVLTTATCLVAYYTAWVTFSFCILNSIQSAQNGGPAVFVFPWDLLQLAQVAAEEGYFTLGSSSSSNSAVSGTMLWLIWLVEALVIFIGAPLVGIAYTREPYFPRSAAWSVPRKLPNTYFGDGAPATAPEMLGDDSFSWMQSLRPVTETVGALAFELFEHPNEETSYLTITKTAVKKEKGKDTYSQENLVQFIELTPANKRQFEQYLETADAASDLPPPAANEPEVDPEAVLEQHNADRDKRRATAHPPPAQPPAQPGLAKPPAKPPAPNTGDEWDQ